MSYYDDLGVPGGRMCEACERDEHWECCMQTWCECDCPGPDGIYIDQPDEKMEQWTNKESSNSDG